MAQWHVYEVYFRAKCPRFKWPCGQATAPWVAKSVDLQGYQGRNRWYIDLAIVSPKPVALKHQRIDKEKCLICHKALYIVTKLEQW